MNNKADKKLENLHSKCYESLWCVYAQELRMQQLK